MFIASFPAGAWQANCYVVAAREGGPCVIIDPGMGAAGTVARLVDEHHLEPRAVLATHGHIDHVADAAAVADRYEVAVHIHADDEILLTDPAAGVGADMMAAVRGIVPERLTRPQRVEHLVDGQRLDAADLTFSVRHAPGHRPGCVLLGTPHPEVGEVVFSGDVIFAGSIGRTDLPGGSMPVMIRTLREVVLGLDDGVALLPGHGPQTTMRTERAHNPYLRPSFLEQS